MKLKKKHYNILKKTLYQFVDSCIDYINADIESCDFSSRWNDQSKNSIRVFNVALNTAQDFENSPQCRCDIEYVCLLHWDDQENSFLYRSALKQAENTKIEYDCKCSDDKACIFHWDEQKNKTEKIPSSRVNNVSSIPMRSANLKTFSTTRRVTRRKLNISQLSELLKKWAENEKITLKSAIPNAASRLKILQLIWTYRDVEAKELKKIPITDLIVHRVTSRPGLKPYNAKQHRFTPDKKWWYQTIIQKDIETDMYERTVIANDRTSQWKTASVLIPKPDQTESRLTFNYHFVYEKLAGSMMKLAQRTHDLLDRPGHRMFFAADMKHDYWNVAVHPEDRHYLTFHVPGIDQLQPTRMPQSIRTSSFTFIELINIILRLISEPYPEPSLLHAIIHTTSSSIFFYIDDIFGDHKTFEKQYHFLEYHFFPRLLWSLMKISLSKLKIEITELKTLGQIHRVDEVLNVKQEFIDKIRNWSVFQNATAVRSFLGTIQSTRRWILNFDELQRSFQRLCDNKTEWRWSESEDLSFQVLRQLCSNVMNMFDHDFLLLCEAYTDASTYDEDIYIRQLQEDEMKSILYDCIAFNITQRNYDTYKRELYIIVHFIKKYEHIFDSLKRNTIYTNHKSLMNFINAQEHENIYARWTNKLRSHNIQIKYIENKKNQMIDDLSRVIFNDKNCESNQLIKNLYKKIKNHKNDIQWFWKIDKKEYRDILKQLSTEDEKRKIEKYDEKFIVRIGWTSFYVKKQSSEICFIESDHDDCSRSQTTVRTFQLSEIIDARPDYTQEEWYSDIYDYYAKQKTPANANKIAMIAFKRKINKYRWNEISGRLLHQNNDKWNICITKKEVTSLLQESHDEADHFSSNIILNRIKNQVFWPFMTSDIRSYIQECLSCAQWITADRHVPLSPIQTYQFYDLFDIDFMNLSTPSKHEFKNICNMIDYFSSDLFSYPTMNTKISDVKQSLEYHKSSDHPLPAAIYWDANIAFRSNEMQKMLDELDIICIIAPSQSHKSLRMIERDNRTLRTTMNKMTLPDENVIDTLRKVASTCNERYVKHLNYTPNQILHDIELRDSVVVRSVKTTMLSDKIVLSTVEEMLPYVWNHMTRREQIHQDVIQRTRKSKQRMKARYDKEINIKMFISDQYVFLLNTNSIFAKNTFRWREPFVIANKANEHNSNYKLLKMNDNRASNQFHDDHLRSFFAREKYLRSLNEQNLPMLRNLRRTKKKIMREINKKQQTNKPFEQWIQYNPNSTSHH